MGADDVAKALMALDDDAVRARVLQGDSGALADFALSKQEEDMIRRAAAENLEVEGFSSEREGGATYQAATYARGNIADPRLASDFSNWWSGVGSRQAKIPWIQEP